MASKVSVNMLTVVHKSSNGISPAFPDVCKTPAPPAPFAPIPYPNIAKSSDTSQPSSTVKCDGQPIMLKKSNFMMSMGDEAGSLFGMVSSKIKGKAYPKMFSFDCKADGDNIMRMTDIMLQNGGSPVNTPPATEVQGPAPAVPGAASIPTEDEQPPKVTDLKFSTATCCCGDELDVEAKTSNVPDDTTLFLVIKDGKKTYPVDAMACPLIKGNKGKVRWRIRRGKWRKTVKWKLKATGTGGPKDSSNELEIKIPADAKETKSGSWTTPAYVKWVDPILGTEWWYPNGNSYGNPWAFDVEIKKADFTVTRKLDFTGASPNFIQKWMWRSEIENVWDNKWRLHRTSCKRGDSCNCSQKNGCCVWPIRIKCKFGGGHGQTRLNRGRCDPRGWGGPNWWYANNWYTNRAGVGAFVRAHEFGHTIGLYDEYPEGACHPSRLFANCPPSIMSSGNRTFERHMTEFKNWFDGKAGAVVGGTKLIRN